MKSRISGARFGRPTQWAATEKQKAAPKRRPTFPQLTECYAVRRLMANAAPCTVCQRARRLNGLTLTFGKMLIRANLRLRDVVSVTLFRVKPKFIGKVISCDHLL
jgi:hypothetical protein